MIAEDKARFRESTQRTYFPPRNNKLKEKRKHARTKNSNEAKQPSSAIKHAYM